MHDFTIRLECDGEVTSKHFERGSMFPMAEGGDHDFAFDGALFLVVSSDGLCFVFQPNKIRQTDATIVD
ncbi:hypothetical protein KQI84_18130 [bacterium]|nr:hypothetical protein [bacterium]